MSILRFVLLTSLALGLSSTAFAQSVVYDNTANDLGLENDLLPAGVNASVVRGSEVTLAGSDRRVTRIDFLLRIRGAGRATFDTQMRFYANDGAGGSPGTLLWESAVVPRLIDSGAPLQYSYDVPSVTVPNTFTWALEITSRSGNTAAMGPSLFAPPVTGAAAGGAWEETAPGSWVFTAGSPFGSRIEAIGLAVPVLPPLGMFFLVGGVALIGARLALRSRSRT